MANSYVEFSEVLPRLNDEEECWLRQQLETVYVFGDQVYAEAELPPDCQPQQADWHGCRAYRDVPDCAADVKDMDLCGPGFEHRFLSDEPRDDGEGGLLAGWGRHLWVYADEWAYLDGLACLVQKFLKRFRPDQCWSLTYATTCSKPRAGEFGGGAIFVTADQIRGQSAYDFIEQQAADFQAYKGNIHAQDKPHD